MVAPVAHWQDNFAIDGVSPDEDRVVLERRCSVRKWAPRREGGKCKLKAFLLWVILGFLYYIEIEVSIDNGRQHVLQVCKLKLTSYLRLCRTPVLQCQFCRPHHYGCLCQGEGEKTSKILQHWDWADHSIMGCVQQLLLSWSPVEVQCLLDQDWGRFLKSHIWFQE